MDFFLFSFKYTTHFPRLCFFSSSFSSNSSTLHRLCGLKAIQPCMTFKLLIVLKGEQHVYCRPHSFPITAIPVQEHFEIGAEIIMTVTAFAMMVRVVDRVTTPFVYVSMSPITTDVGSWHREVCTLFMESLLRTLVSNSFERVMHRTEYP